MFFGRAASRAVLYKTTPECCFCDGDGFFADCWTQSAFRQKENRLRQDVLPAELVVEPPVGQGVLSLGHMSMLLEKGTAISPHRESIYAEVI